MTTEGKEKGSRKYSDKMTNYSAFEYIDKDAVFFSWVEMQFTIATRG